MADKKTIGIYKAYLKEHLSKKRYTHSVNVANSAVELAKRYGADADKAYVAGLLHDVAKEIPALELAAIVSISSVNVCDIEKKAVPLFHGIAGAELVQTLFDIHDPEIISAIRYHTVACGNMPKLSQIVYLADLISADRDYKDVEKMRKLAYSDFYKAMLEAVGFSVSSVVKKHGYIPEYSIEAYNQYNYLYLIRKKNKEKK